MVAGIPEIFATTGGFTAAVEEVGERSTGEDLWADQIRQLAPPFTVRKISPTLGLVTEHDYRFVTLLPLIELPEPDAAYDASVDGVQKIVAWLSKLDHVGRPDERSAPLPFSSMGPGGTAARWDPSTGFEEDGRPSPIAPRLPRGAVWFPLGKDDQGNPLWRLAPSIVARNADVMHVVERFLAM